MSDNEEIKIACPNCHNIDEEILFAWTEDGERICMECGERFYAERK